MIKVSVIATCPFCGFESTISVGMTDLILWQAGKNAQDAFPYLSADEREALISCICPKCWADTFGDDEDEEDSEDWEDDIDECGYNPYMGCYDYDC